MKTEMQINEMWAEFEHIKKKHETNSSRYEEIKNALLEHYYPIVFKMARKMQKKLKEVQEDDLVSWGTDGLFDAVKSYDSCRGVKFETYAMHRIRGSILDNVRNVDWIPRLVRYRATKLEKIKQQHEAEVGRSLTDAELSIRLGMTPEEFDEMVQKATPTGCMSMHAKPSDDNSELGGFKDVESRDRSPIDSLLRVELFQKLLGTNFTRLERKIIVMHYVDGLTMKEIAVQTGYSESRISQMHAEIISRLQKKIERNPEYASDILCVFSS